MRQIYTSPRIANVEMAVALMNENGIETAMRNRRAWQNDAWKRFSYAKPPARAGWPQVWIVHSEDQPRARQLLRDAGIEPATRFADELAEYRKPELRKRSLIQRVRTALLVIIATVIGLIVYIRVS